MELIAKISKGSNMDQIYLPKKRPGLPIGTYVSITSIKEIEEIKLHYYNVKTLESIKIILIKDIFKAINQRIECSNIIITGSFLEKGFNFNDMDILIINDKKLTKNLLENLSKELFRFGIKIQLIMLDLKTLREGISTDPLYEAMLSKYVSRERLIFNVKRVINPKLLDLYLIKSKTLIQNFDSLIGTEKYAFIRNLVAINLFLDNKKITLDSINNSIKEIFNLVSISLIKDNMLDKSEFIKIYKSFYQKTFNKIMENLDATKQE